MHECCRKARAVPGSAPLAHQRGYANLVKSHPAPWPCPTAAGPHPHCGDAACGAPPHAPLSLRASPCFSPGLQMAFPRFLLPYPRSMASWSKPALRCHHPPPAPLVQQACVSCTPQTAKAAFLGGGGISKFRKFPQGARLVVSRCPGEGRVSRPALQHSTDISGRGKPAAAIIYSPGRALPCPQLFFFFFFFFLRA